MWRYCWKICAKSNFTDKPWPFFKIFIFPKKYISHLLQEKREGILNEETLPIGFRPIQPFVFCEAWYDAVLFSLLVIFSLIGVNNYLNIFYRITKENPVQSVLNKILWIIHIFTESWEKIHIIFIRNSFKIVSL